MKILVYYGKHGDEYWMADTPEQLEAAMRGLFASLDECDYYEDEDHAEKAREGDLETIKCILYRHSDREYEQWDIKEARNPCLIQTKGEHDE